MDRPRSRGGRGCGIALSAGHGFYPGNRQSRSWAPRSRLREPLPASNWPAARATPCCRRAMAASLSSCRRQARSGILAARWLELFRQSAAVEDIGSGRRQKTQPKVIGVICWWCVELTGGILLRTPKGRSRAMAGWRAFNRGLQRFRNRPDPVGFSWASEAQAAGSAVLTGHVLDVQPSLA